jgi:hypothetical protein
MRFRRFGREFLKKIDILGVQEEMGAGKKDT